MKRLLSITLVFTIMCSSLMMFSVSATNYTQTSKTNKFELLKTYIISHGIQKDKQWEISEELSLVKDNSNFTLSYDENNNEIIVESSMALENASFRTEFRIKEIGRPFESTFENLLINEGLTLKVTEYTQPLFVDENYCPSAKSYDVIGNNISVLNNYSRAEKDNLKSIGEKGLSSGIVLTILSLGHYLANNEIDLSLPDFGFVHCDYYGSEPYVPDTLFELYIGQGAIYFSQGLYYETIDEIQTFCDACWYKMTAEQQEKALYYLWQSKTNLADYLLNTGVAYYNNSLYYEAQKFFADSIELYPEYSTEWKLANDYLYSTNERIKELEAPEYYSATNIITYTSVTGKELTDMTAPGWMGDYGTYSYSYANCSREEMESNVYKYVDKLGSIGWILTDENYDDNDLMLYLTKGSEKITIMIIGKVVLIVPLEYFEFVNF